MNPTTLPSSHELLRALELLHSCSLNRMEVYDAGAGGATVGQLQTATAFLHSEVLPACGACTLLVHAVLFRPRHLCRAAFKWATVAAGASRLMPQAYLRPEGHSETFHHGSCRPGLQHAAGRTSHQESQR